jgi:hypothetical protein
LFIARRAAVEADFDSLRDTVLNLERRLDLVEHSGSSEQPAQV